MTPALLGSDRWECWCRTPVHLIRLPINIRVGLASAATWRFDSVAVVFCLYSGTTLPMKSLQPRYEECALKLLSLSSWRAPLSSEACHRASEARAATSYLCCESVSDQIADQGIGRSRQKVAGRWSRFGSKRNQCFKEKNMSHRVGGSLALRMQLSGMREGKKPKPAISRR